MLPRYAGVERTAWPAYSCGRGLAGPWHLGQVGLLPRSPHCLAAEPFPKLAAPQSETLQGRFHVPWQRGWQPAERHLGRGRAGRRGLSQ